MVSDAAGGPVTADDVKYENCMRTNYIVVYQMKNEQNDNIYDVPIYEIIYFK